eukprot:6209556-Pleurochrysis_carterae.AAC.4
MAQCLMILLKRGAINMWIMLQTAKQQRQHKSLDLQRLCLWCPSSFTCNKGKAYFEAPAIAIIVLSLKATSNAVFSFDNNTQQPKPHG